MSTYSRPYLATKERALWVSIPKFILINLAIALIISLMICPSCFISWDGLSRIADDFIFAFFFSSVLSWGGSQVDFYFDQKMSWVEQPGRRLVFTILSYMAYTFIASYVLVFLIAYFTNQFSLNEIPWKGIAQGTQNPMLFAFFFMAVFTTRSWLMEWRKSAIEAEQLRTEKIASQYQSLKNQLNPHFLFNSLNVLSNLVYEDADKSAEFIQKLSKIYRYVLEVQQEELVLLEKELEFARNYLELQQIRFEANLVYAIKIDSATERYLPPLSLQLLLENAIKHNEASKDNPLYIEIYQEGNDLAISNSFQPKRSQQEPSTGIGLKNIEMRYDFLSERKPIIIQTENEFLVRLPLLEVRP
ncbi:sensor histidine kinase [Algoriphagus namhaensis]